MQFMLYKKICFEKLIFFSPCNIYTEAVLILGIIAHITNVQT